jgi:hypothetical protein
VSEPDLDGDVMHSGLHLTFHEVLGGSADDLAALLAIHAELFPQYVYYQPYMRQRAPQPPDANPPLVEHWWLIKVDGEPAGVRFFNYSPQRDCGLGLAVGILPAYRRLSVNGYGRLSEAVLFETLAHLRLDAQATSRPEPVGMVSEIEEYIWPRCLDYGYVRLSVDYEEPSFVHNALVAETPDVTFRPIGLGCLPTRPDTFDPAAPAMLANVVRAFLVDHYGLPDDHEAVQRALNSIEPIRK